MTETELEELKAQTRHADATEPRIREVQIEGENLVVSFGGGAVAGATLTVPARSLPDFADAPVLGDFGEALRVFEITSNGDAIHWPRCGVYLQAVSLVRSVFGLRAVTASEMGKRGGVVGGGARTQAKGQASRANGAKGGRPRKVAA